MLTFEDALDSEELIPVPEELPPLEGLEAQDREEAAQRPRIWLWTLIAALAVILLMVYVLVLGALGFYDGLKDRVVENQQFAQEHYAQGMQHLQAGDYELAIAEFELALRHDSSLSEAMAELQEAKELARALVTPTSETRRDAAELLYKQAVAYYEDGNLDEALAVFDELRGLDAEYERQSVETMLMTVHYQLGLDAVREDRLPEAQRHFEAVLALKPGDLDSQNQLDLIHLYTAALNYWDRDWSATIQALKGLYTLAPGYKDVQSRLHDAYVYHAQTYADRGDWCQASSEYAAAAAVLPLEATVDQRDEAAIRCQSSAETPVPTPTAQPAVRPTARPTAGATAGGQPAATPQPTAGPTSAAASSPVGKGRIAFTSYDAVRKRQDIYLVDLAQGDARLLIQNASQPALTPGGKRIAFHNLDPQHLGLGVLDLQANQLSELTAHVEDSVPAWSPAADQIVFSSNKEGDRKWRIYAISPQEVRGEGDQWAIGEMPAWSPDGNQIAYHGCDERGDNCGIWLMKAGGFSPARLTSNAQDTAPVWSPDGGQIAFLSSRAGNWEIYLVDVASGQEKRLTDEPAADVAAAWSPDGQRLAFLSNRGGAWAVYILEIKSGKMQKVIATGDAYPDPVSERLSWAP
jgi:tetratricopeptide (TPR) repeat protein